MITTMTYDATKNHRKQRDQESIHPMIRLDTSDANKSTRHLQDKAKSARSLSVLVQAHNYLLNLASSREKLVNLLLGCVEGQIANIQRRRGLQRVVVLLLRSRKPPVPIRRQLAHILRIARQARSSNRKLERLRTLTISSPV